MEKHNFAFGKLLPILPSEFAKVLESEKVKSFDGTWSTGNYFHLGSLGEVELTATLINPIPEFRVRAVGGTPKDRFKAILDSVDSAVDHSNVIIKSAESRCSAVFNLKGSTIKGVQELYAEGATKQEIIDGAELIVLSLLPPNTKRGKNLDKAIKVVGKILSSSVQKQ